MKLLILTLSLLFSCITSASAQICVAAKEKATNKPISYECGSRKADRDIILDKATAQGFTRSQLSFVELTPTELNDLIETHFTAPAKAAQDARQASLKGKETAIKAKLGLTDAEYENLKAIIREGI